MTHFMQFFNLNSNNLRLILSAILGVFATIGITRMTFGVVLPLLQNDLNLSATEVGFIGTTNFIGYFIGVLFANYFYHKYKLVWVVGGFIFLEAMFMALMSISTNYVIIAGLFFLAGYTSAVGYMSIMSYLAHNISPDYKGRALGLAISGNSFAISFSGLSVWTLGTLGNYAWDDNYLVFVVATFIVAAIIFMLLKNDSIGENKAQKTLSNKALLTSPNFWKMAIVYFTFGLTYTIFLTFFVSHIINDFQINIDLASNFWIILGVISIISGPLFGLIADKTTTWSAFTGMYFLQAFACIILVVGIHSEVIIYLSVLGFGLAVWGVPSLMFLLSYQYFGKHNTAKATALVTLAFAFAQIIGPISGGIVYDTLGSYNLIFLVVGVLSAIAGGLSWVFNKQH
jgi:predicted MFS family arabinose efflux permease